MVPTGHKSPGCFLLSSAGLFYQNLDGAQEEICGQGRMCGMSVGHRLSRNEDQPMQRLFEEEGPSCFPEYKSRKVTNMLKSSTVSRRRSSTCWRGMCERWGWRKEHHVLGCLYMMESFLTPPISCCIVASACASRSSQVSSSPLFVMCKYLFLYSHHASRVSPKELAGLKPKFVFTPSSPAER